MNVARAEMNVYVAKATAQESLTQETDCQYPQPLQGLLLPLQLLPAMQPHSLVQAQIRL